ncbi:MAG: hypothetical protein IJZ76_07335 [Lachnospiraceae bacterium]|nr:hypothetical protein [Lachnospiraceae bacterium]
MSNTIIKEIQPLTEEQKDQIKDAARKEVVFDEDCPEISSAMEKAIRSAVKGHKRKKA